MHILAFILIFIVGSIIAACDGDYSGIAAIGKFVGFFVLLFAVLWLFTQPVLLIIAIVVLVLIVIAFSAKGSGLNETKVRYTRADYRTAKVVSYNQKKQIIT